MSIELVTLALSLLIIAIVFIPTLVTGSSPVPTSRKVRRTILKVLPERLPGPKTGTIYDLGSGWGGMAFALADKYPNHQVIGYELSPLPWLMSRLHLWISGPKNLKFEITNYNRKSLSNAALVLCYLLPDPMEKLRPKLESELNSGVLVVSNTFAFRGWYALDDKMADDVYNSHVFLYEMGNTDDPSMASRI